MMKNMQVHDTIKFRTKKRLRISIVELFLTLGTLGPIITLMRDRNLQLLLSLWGVYLTDAGKYVLVADLQSFVVLWRANYFYLDIHKRIFSF